MKWIAAIVVLALTHVGVYFVGHLNGVSRTLTARPDAGRFLSDATLTQLDNELWAVKGDFVYVDPDGKPWLAPDGSKVNGASIPAALWQVVGPPLRGAYVKASIVHDVACEEQRETSEAVHRMFYYACLAGGLPETQARMMFWGVQTFGPTWDLSAGQPTAPPTGDGPRSEIAARVEGFRNRSYSVLSRPPLESAPPSTGETESAEPPPELTPEAARRALAYFESHADLPVQAIPDLGAAPMGE